MIAGQPYCQLVYEVQTEECATKYVVHRYTPVFFFFYFFIEGYAPVDRICSRSLEDTLVRLFRVDIFTDAGVDP